MPALKLGRTRDHRNRTIRNLVTSLVLYEKVTTTEAKAKAALPVAERLVTMARRQDLASRRYAKSLLFDMNAVRKLFEDLPERWGTRTSGFIRLTKVHARPGDGAARAQLELLVTPLEEVIASETKTRTRVRKAAPARSEAAEAAPTAAVEEPAAAEAQADETANPA